MPLCDDEAIGSILRARESNKKPEVDSLKGYPKRNFSAHATVGPITSGRWSVIP